MIRTLDTDRSLINEWLQSIKNNDHNFFFFFLERYYISKFYSGAWQVAWVTWPGAPGVISTCYLTYLTLFFNFFFYCFLWIKIRFHACMSRTFFDWASSSITVSKVLKYWLCLSALGVFDGVFMVLCIKSYHRHMRIPWCLSCLYLLCLFHLFYCSR